MTVQETASRWKMTWRVPTVNAQGAPAVAVMTAESSLDGKESPNLVDGKPSGQTMAIKRVDERHTHTILRFHGKQTGTSKSELSAGGKVIRTENDNSVSSPNGMSGRQTQFWDKQSLKDDP